MAIKKGQMTDNDTGDILYPQTSYDMVTNKPTDFPPSSHIHDDRYFTENEINTKLNSYALKTHNHDEVYAPKTHTHADYAAKVHNHDDRYFTESEMNTKLSEKLNTTGNASNVTNTFTQSGTLTNLTTGEKLSASLGKTMKAIDDLISHVGNKSNPHGVTKSQVGLSNVDNTSDVNKPISSAVQNALNGKAAISHNHDDRYYSKQEIDEKCPYDIGDLYITLNETIPSVKWKGTEWERVEGLVPVGYKASDADFGTLGKTGGSKSVTLTKEHLPAHNHDASVNSAGAHTHTVSGTAASAGSHDHKLVLKTKDGSGTQNTDVGINDGSWNGVLTHAWLDQSPIQHSGIHTHDVSGTTASAAAHTHTLTVNNTGGSKAHSNLQPYKVFNMWLRTA